MPAKGAPRQAAGDLLSDEELLMVARAAVGAGVDKIRVTGGEPLVRKGIIKFLADLKRIPGLKKLVLTTNGVFLGEMAENLRAAGVESLNISLDSMRPDIFFRITRGGDLQKVREGIAAAERAGFPYMKINMVVMRGVNDDEVLDFAALTVDNPYKVRFIEYMPTLQEPGGRSLTVPGEELLARLSRRFTVEQANKEEMAGPAVYYKIKGAAGAIGFITPMSCHFCHECNRIRVTSSGVLKSCLFDNGVMSLKPFLEAGDAAGLQEALRQSVKMKPQRHALAAGEAEQASFCMSQVGG
jgi:cyclic pyranopterin phosphate synthase